MSQTMTFAQIDDHIASFNLTAPAHDAAPHNKFERLLTLYKAVSPILGVVLRLPLLPPAWRSALSLFLTALDEVIVGTPAAPAPGKDFKAGKDL